MSVTGEQLLAASCVDCGLSIGIVVTNGDIATARCALCICTSMLRDRLRWQEKELKQAREDRDCFARDVLRSGSRGDWACAQCRPHSDMLIAGFQCAYHRAEELLGDAEPTGKTHQHG